MRLAQAFFNRKKALVMNLPAVFPLNMKFMLQHDKVSLPLIVHQQRLELSTQGVQEISIPGHYCVAGEKTDPFQARNDATRLLFARKLAGSLDAGNEATEGNINLFECQSPVLRLNAYLSVGSAAPSTFCVICAHVRLPVSHAFWVKSSHPSFTRTLTISGKP